MMSVYRAKQERRKRKNTTFVVGRSRLSRYAPIRAFPAPDSTEVPSLELQTSTSRMVAGSKPDDLRLPVAEPAAYPLLTR